MAIETGVLTPREPAVDLLKVISEGTYTSFAQALKEFASNAYDADALRVDISIEDDGNAFTIRDDGVGMTSIDFGDSFASIARTGKSAARSPRGKTRLGRLKIGRFGIGALAVAGLADKFVVRSSRRGSREGFEAAIDLRALRSHFGRGEDLSKHWRFDSNRWTDEKPESHFSEIRVEGIREDVRDFLQRPGELTLEEFFESTDQLSGKDQLLWQLGMICPVAYEKSYPIPAGMLDRKRDSVLIRHARSLLAGRFEVFLDRTRVRRRILLPRYRPRDLTNPSKRALLEKRNTGWDVQCFKAGKAESALSCEGYLVIQAHQLFPVDLRGVLIRLRGVAVGWHRTLNVPDTLATMLRNMSGEIWVEGLEDALQFDRESFREDHPHFQWLRKQLEQQVDEAEKGFRLRSKRRVTTARSQQSSSRATTRKSSGTTRSSQGAQTSFLLPQALPSAPGYITRIAPQINGCWDRGWYEACAVMIRRLVETLLIFLYDQRGWTADLKDPVTHEFVGLKRMVDKVTGDARIGLDRRTVEDLKRLKELGDISAHDFRIQVKRGDLQSVRDALRFTCERLLFKANGGP